MPSLYSPQQQPALSLVERWPLTQWLRDARLLVTRDQVAVSMFFFMFIAVPLGLLVFLLLLFRLGYCVYSRREAKRAAHQSLIQLNADHVAEHAELLAKVQAELERKQRKQSANANAKNNENCSEDKIVNLNDEVQVLGENTSQEKSNETNHQHQFSHQTKVMQLSCAVTSKMDMAPAGRSEHNF